MSDAPKGRIFLSERTTTSFSLSRYLRLPMATPPILTRSPVLRRERTSPATVTDSMSVSGIYFLPERLPKAAYSLYRDAPSTPMTVAL